MKTMVSLFILTALLFLFKRSQNTLVKYSTIQSPSEEYQPLFANSFNKSFLNKLKPARCGVPPGPLSFRLGNPWRKKIFTWKLNRHNIPWFGEDQTRGQLHEAFNDWARYAPVTFYEVNQYDNADIQIAFLYRNQDELRRFDGPGGTLAYAFFPPSGIIRFEAEEPWTNRYDQDGFNFRLVATHEIGHALGIAHSDVPSSLMFEQYHILQPDKILPLDDQYAIRQLYGYKAISTPKYSRPMKTTIPNYRLTTEITKTSRQITGKKLEPVTGLIITRMTTMPTKQLFYTQSVQYRTQTSTKKTKTTAKKKVKNTTKRKSSKTKVTTSARKVTATQKKHKNRQHKSMNNQIFRMNVIVEDGDS